MGLPQKTMDILNDVGQAAIEVPCLFEDCREFVSVSMANPKDILAAGNRFHYLPECERIFHAMRFRVDSAVIEQDLNVGYEELLDLQRIYLPSEEALEFILNVWQVDPADLLSPRDVEIPV